MTGHHHHDHDHDHHPGLFHQRDAPVDRDYDQRAFTIGIGGPVGSGKTALLLALCLELRDRYALGVVTNDIFTREDAEFLVRHNALPQERIRACHARRGRRRRRRSHPGDVARRAGVSAS